MAAGTKTLSERWKSKSENSHGGKRERDTERE